MSEPRVQEYRSEQVFFDLKHDGKLIRTHDNLHNAEVQYNWIEHNNFDMSGHAIIKRTVVSVETITTTEEKVK